MGSSSQPALEPTCFAALALGSFPGRAVERAQELLLHTQNPNGSWPAFAGDDTDGAWVTSLAVMALQDVVPAISARSQGVHWLMSCAGKESNWFWKWKFRTADRHVRFDPDKYGWPWFPDTVSWVVPTAFAVLALSQLPCSCGGLEPVLHSSTKLEKPPTLRRLLSRWFRSFDFLMHFDTLSPGPPPRAEHKYNNTTQRFLLDSHFSENCWAFC